MQHISDDMGNNIISHRSSDEQIEKFFTNPTKERVIECDISPFEKQVKSHKPFIFTKKLIQFNNEFSDIPVEFTPIELCQYRCYALFCQ